MRPKTAARMEEWCTENGGEASNQCCCLKPSLVGEGWVRRFKIVLFALLLSLYKEIKRYLKKRNI